MEKDIVDFIRSAVDQTPLEAKAAFDEIMNRKLSAKIEQEFDNYKENFFVDAEEDTEEDTENEDAE